MRSWSLAINTKVTILAFGSGIAHLPEAWAVASLAYRFEIGTIRSCWLPGKEQGGGTEHVVSPDTTGTNTRQAFVSAHAFISVSSARRENFLGRVQWQFEKLKQDSLCVIVLRVISRTSFRPPRIDHRPRTFSARSRLSAMNVSAGCSSLSLRSALPAFAAPSRSRACSRASTRLNNPRARSARTSASFGDLADKASSSSQHRFMALMSSMLVYAADSAVDARAAKNCTCGCRLSEANVLKSF